MGTPLDWENRKGYEEPPSKERVYLLRWEDHHEVEVVAKDEDEAWDKAYDAEFDRTFVKTVHRDCIDQGEPI